MVLYGFWRSLATYRVKVALGLKGIGVEEVSIDLLKGEQHKADYRALNPQAVLPALVLDDGGPPLFQSLVVPRVRLFLEKEMNLEEPARNRWLSHWTLKALEDIEAHLAREQDTGRFCHGGAPTLADICLAGQVVAATGYFKCDVSRVPTAMRIYDECMQLEAFSQAHPLKQPGAGGNR
jgi:maleylacetoacetate isomerase